MENPKAHIDYVLYLSSELLMYLILSMVDWHYVQLADVEMLSSELAEPGWCLQMSSVFSSVLLLLLQFLQILMQTEKL